MDENNIDYFSKVAEEYESDFDESSTMFDAMNSGVNFDLLLENMKYLSKIDTTFIMLSFMYKMSQKNIADFLQKTIGGKISQVGVSVRLRRALEKLRFVISAPSLDFIKVREDFILLFPEEIRYIAFYFYFNHTQSRVRHFIGATQCTAALELEKVLRYLNDNKLTPDLDKRCLVEIYLEFFELLKKSSTINNLFFRNDFIKNSRLIEKESLLSLK